MSDTPGSVSDDPTSSSFVMMSLARLARLAQEAEISGRAVSQPQATQVVAIRSAATVSSKPPLVLVHPIGGSILPYRDLSTYLTPDRDIYGIQSHADDARSSMNHEDIESLAAEYIRLLSCAGVSGPIVVGGYSLGGAVAFEVARQMQSAGQAVDAILIIDTPRRIRPLSETRDQEITTGQLLGFGKMLAATAGRQLDLASTELDELSVVDRVQRMVSRLRELHVVSAGSDERLFYRIYKLVQHNAILQRQYVAQLCAADVLLIRTTVEEALLREEAGSLCDDPTFGWQACCEKQITIRHVTCSHFQLLYPPHIQQLALSIQSILDERSP
jgi:thioesterase domain-containing protein